MRNSQVSGRFAVVSWFLFLSCGCAQFGGKPIATDLNAYQPLPFKKLINQAYAKESKGQDVKVECRFLMLFNDVAGAPSQYRSGDWVRIGVHDMNSMSEHWSDVMVPKSASDICFELKQGDPIAIYGRVANWSDLRGNETPALIVYQIERQP